MRHERGASVTLAGHDIDNACRQPGLAADLGEGERGERRLLSRLQHDSVAGGERWRDLPSQHQQRKVPWDDLAAHADRPIAGELALDQLGPAGVMIEVASNQRDIDIARLSDRLAIVHGLKHREEAVALLDMPGHRIEISSAFVAGELRPGLERTRSSSHRPIDVLGRALRDPRQRLPVSRIGDLEAFAGSGVGELAVDEVAEPVLVALQPGQYVLVAFRRRTVIHALQYILDVNHSSSLRPSGGGRWPNSGR